MNIIQAILPKKYHDKWVIAGGWAACPALASDMDVWVLGIDDIDVVREELLAHTGTSSGVFVGRYLVVQVQDEIRTAPGYEIENVLIRKVAKLTAVNLSIHLLVTDAPSPAELLMGFDISTHQVAILHNGIVVKGPNWTPTNVLCFEPPRQQPIG